MANKSGNLVRVTLDEDANAESVSAELEAILVKQNRKPKKVDGEELADALKDEEWRDSSSIGELSEIEFRTVFARRVKEFGASGGLDRKTASRLVEISEEVLAETPKSDEQTQWGKFCGDMASSMLKKSEELLTKEQLHELVKKLKARIPG